MQYEETALLWPDNVPLYSPASQMDFFLKPRTEFIGMAELVEAVQADDREKVRVAFRSWSLAASQRLPCHAGLLYKHRHLQLLAHQCHVHQCILHANVVTLLISSGTQQAIGSCFCRYLTTQHIHCS